MYALNIEAANKKHQLLEHVLITNLEQQRQLGCSMTNNHILYRLSISCHENIRIDKTLPTQHNNNTTAIPVVFKQPLSVFWYKKIMLKPAVRRYGLDIKG